MRNHVLLIKRNVLAEDNKILIQAHFNREREGGAVMGVLKFVATIFLFFLLGSQALQPGQAYADCCGCYCMPGCTCGGQTDPDLGITCGWCRSANPVWQVNTSIDKSGAPLQPVNETVPSTVAQPDVTEQVMELMTGGKCFRNKAAFSLLGNARDELKYVPVRF
jgi:hypothetical protein